MKRNKSFLFLVSTLFIAGYVAVSFGQAYYAKKDFLKSRTEAWLEQVAKDSDVALGLAQKFEFALLEKYLQTRMSLKLINFYVIYQNETVILHSEKGIEASLKALTSDSYSDQEVVIRKFEAGGFKLIVGTYFDQVRFYNAFVKSDGGSYLLDLLFVSLYLIFVVSYFFEDFKLILHRLAFRGDREHLPRGTKSKEAELVAKGFEKWEQVSESLRTSKYILERSVLPALKTELDSGLKPPYTFECALVRLDINHYTEGFNSARRQDFLEFVNKFFVRTTAVVGRHSGLIKEFLGDEVIFYFKGDAVETAPKAFHCLRDLIDLVVELQAEGSGYLKKPFTFKAAVSLGTLYFGPQVDRMNISGEPLVESARLLNEVTNKDECTVIEKSTLMNERLLKGFKARSTRDVLFKGYAESTTVTEWENNPETGADKDWNFLSDQMLMRGLDQLVTLKEPKQASEWLEKLHRKSLSFLGSVCFDRLMFVFHELQRRSESAPEWIPVLSQLTKLVSQSPSSESMKTTLEQYLESNFFVGDMRLQANTIESLQEVVPHKKYDFLSRRFKEHRLIANAIVADASHGISQRTVLKLKELIQDSRPLYQASGFYALRVILDRLATENPQELVTNFDLQKLYEAAQKMKVDAQSDFQQKLLRSFLADFTSKTVTKKVAS